jgi:hypothetical protein
MGSSGGADFAAWIDPEGLPPYLGVDTRLSANSRALLGSPGGPTAMLAHFDISIVGNAPMHNLMTDHLYERKEVPVMCGEIERRGTKMTVLLRTVISLPGRS